MQRSRFAQVLSADLNVTPMLDVLLVLLVIFMASMEARHTMDAQLPAPCERGCNGSGDAIVLEVLPGPTYRLNRAPVSARELPERLRSTYAGRPEKVIQVAGHRTARYADVVEAMDIARSAGARVITIPPSDLVAQP